MAPGESRAVRKLEPGSEEQAAAAKRDYLFLTLLASATSLAAFLHFFQQGQILFYGDAVAHINIARRVFDSRTPGPLQLGTVWLPLPHLLTIPFIISDWAWRTGVGGSIVSMAGYVAGVVGIARLCWQGSLLPGSSTLGQRRLAGWVAALVYGLNPNLLYLQATAMTEPLSLALGVWAIVFYAGFASAEQNDASRIAALERCAMVLAAGMLTRYENWLLALIVGGLVSWQMLKSENAQTLRRSYVKFILLCAAVPTFWLGYNYGAFQNALEFANGPYSAHAIAERTTRAGDPAHPGYHNLRLAALYFFKAARMNVGEGWWMGAILIFCALGIGALAARGKWKLMLLLAMPLIFYPLSVAYGGVPIFIPVWYPFSYYNVRYGLQLLPLLAVGCGGAIWLIGAIRFPRARLAAYLASIALIAGCYIGAAKAAPICLREAQVNSAGRIAFEVPLAEKLAELPRDSSLLMFNGEHVGALQRAGLHLARTVNESNHPQWELALRQPAQQSDFAVAIDADPVARAVASHPEGLLPFAAVQGGGHRAVIYKCARRRE